MNLFYEIKKKDGRTKRRRLVKRDNNNEASVIQEVWVSNPSKGELCRFMEKNIQEIFGMAQKVPSGMDLIRWLRMMQPGVNPHKAAPSLKQNRKDHLQPEERIPLRKTDSYLFFLYSLTSEMEFNPFTEPSNFVDLLSSQQNVVFGNVPESQLPFFASQDTHDSNIDQETQGSRKSTDDIVLISSWLNTSKDTNASPKLVGCEKREAAHCKNRWQKINDLVCKFCGAFEAATRERTSGQNETDVLKLAHEIFFTNYKKKFPLEHAWKELRNDQKWTELSTAKAEGSSKKRKSMDVSHSASSKAIDVDSGDEATTRLPGVKASKARSKKPIGDAKYYEEFQSMWSMKKEDLTIKKELSKIKLLETLIGKEGPLADYEETLKKKLINELGYN
uniref:No apical meristem-associated C-terminal domain-containing protein n=1 Tax=Brassica oleracea var. oleracea TaxID=109376 RepID=A0A0D3CFV5_BRAOL